MLGFALPQFGEAAHADVAEFASAAEGLGAGSLWVGDRPLAAQNPRVGYVGSDTVPLEFRTCLDPLIALTIAGSATTTARLGASVLVAPFYAPVPLARQLSSVDVVSGGRLMPGFGIGWSPDEFQAAGVPFTDRGAQLDEFLDVLAAVWGPDPVAHEGNRWSVPPSWIGLKPVQKPHPPIYLSAFKPAALRRVGRRADGWLPVVSLPGPVDLNSLNRDRRIVDEAAATAGRSAGDINTYVRVNVAKDAAMDDVAAAIRILHDGGYPDVFVDLLYAAVDVDQKLHWVELLLAATA
jgi:probable F420-dependent oxidoreductase